MSSGSLQPPREQDCASGPFGEQLRDSDLQGGSGSTVMSVEGVAGHGSFWGGIEGLAGLGTCIDGSTQGGRALLGERGQLGEGGGSPQEATMM